jgi:hypothetical protein
MRITARAIAHALSGKRAQRLGDGGFLCSCPVPSHGRGRGDSNPSLRVANGDTRILVHCFGGCDSRDVLDELHRRGLLATSTPYTKPASHFSTRPDDHARKQHEKAAWLWSQRRPIAGTIAGRYLHARGITCPLPATLAFLPPTKPDHHPAMLAAFAIPDKVEPGALGPPLNVDAVHLTLLTPDGRGKAVIEKPKICVGRPAGRPITLAPIGDSLALTISEGIEDGLSVASALGVGAWAAGAAGFMAGLADAVPNYIECVTIFGHDDPAGQRGARTLADRLLARGIEVFLEGVP